MFITDDGIRLNAKLDMPDGRSGKCPLVIVIHGFTGHMEETHITAVSRLFNEIGCATLRVDMYGHGNSGGSFRNHTLYKWLSNAMAVIDYARGLDFVTGLYLCGHSQGGLTVMLAAALKRDVIRGLIPLSPATCIPEGARRGSMLGVSFDPEHIPDELVFKDGMILGGNHIRVAQAICVEDAIAAYRGPVLLVHGSDDETVPAACSVEAQKAYANAELAIIPGDTHCYDRHLDQVTDALKRWMQKQTAAASDAEDDGAEQHSEQDLKHAAEFREGIHREALERLQKLHPEIESVVDRWPVEAYFQRHWDYPGKWYAVVAIPEAFKSRKALVDAIVSDTLAQSGGSAGERKGYQVNAKKIDAKRYDYEKLFTVKVDQNNRSCTVVGKDDKGRYILEYYEEYNIGSAIGSVSDFYVLTDAEYRRYARMALVNGHLTEADYERLCGDGKSGGEAADNAADAVDVFFKLIAEYPRLDVVYDIVLGDPASCRGCEAHRTALRKAFRKLSENDRELRCDIVDARGKQIDAGQLFAPAREAEELNYRGAFLYPPHGTGYTDADFDRVNAALFPNGTDDLEVYEWTTDWSNFFDDGREWWGTLCLTVYDKSLDRYVVILASSTD
ncbi:MAG: alpha/beta hydrolase [Ruminococcaceae bacterium]|nr:alpha/beta hydrolase [Oscillospiraceae bacterium]